MVSKNTTANPNENALSDKSDADRVRQRELEIQRAREAEAKRIEAMQRELLEREALESERQAAETRAREQNTKFEPINVKNVDGSTFSQNALGQVCSTTDVNGTTREFSYDEKGDLKSFTEGGKVWSTTDGTTWEAPGETARTMRAVVNAEDGTFAIAEAGVTKVAFLNGNALTKDASGNIVRDKQQQDTEKVADESKQTEAVVDRKSAETVVNRKPAEFVVDRKKMEVAADAFYANTAGQLGTGEDEVNAILKDKTVAEKQVMDEIYRSKYGVSLKDVLKDEMSGSDLEKSLTLLQKKDGDADDAGRLRTNLVELTEYFGRSSFNIEKDIRQTVSTMNSQQIEALDKEYRQRYGKSLRQTLMDDPNLSKDSKEMLVVYFKGTDKRTNDDSQKLFSIALNSGDVEKFNESAATATTDARKQFMATGGSAKLAAAFTEGSETYNHALDYVKFGRLSTATKVADNTSWLGDNEEAIERSLKDMPAEERKNYLNGKLLSEGKPVEGLTNEQKVQAKSTYESINKALKGAGDSWEIAKWEDQIAVKDGSLVTALAAHRGTFYDDCTHLVLKDIENMSEHDWKSYKSDAGYRQRVDTVLKDYLSTDEYSRAKTLLDDKAAATDYESSKKLGNRDILTVIKDNEGVFENDEVEIWNAIENMSTADQEKYRTDKKFRASVDEAITRSLDAGAEQNVATGMLQRVLKGESPKADIVDKLNKHAADFDTDEGAVIRDIEKAFAADPTLRGRINNPKNDADKNLASRFDSALRKALDPSEYDRYAKTLLSEGRISQSLKQELNTGYFDDDEQGTYSDMATLGQSKDKKSLEEKSKILGDKAYQDQVLGHLSEDERIVAINALRQGELRPEDKIRSQMLGVGTGETEIKETLRQLSPEQKQQLKLDYAKKYGNDISVDLLDELGGQDSRDVSRLLMKEPQSDREAFNNARDEVNESRDGIGRWWVDTTWDGTGYMTDDAVLNMQRKLSDASAKYKTMSPEERKEMESSIRENLDGFVRSKGAAADMLVDAVIIAAAIAGAKFTGGASLSLIMYTTLAGAAFKVASKSAIMGADYDWASTQLLSDALTGAIDTGTMFLGPAQLAMAMKLGEKSAATATRKVLMEGGEQLLKSEMRQTFGKEVTKLVSTSIAHGEKGVSDKAILELAKKFAIEGQEETLAAAMKTSLKESFEAEGKNALNKLVAETSLNSTAGAAGGGLAGGTRGALEWDTSKSVADNLKMVAAQTGAGALTGMTMAGGITLGFKTISAPISKGLEHFRTTGASNSPEVRVKAVVTSDGGNAMVTADTNPHIQGVMRKDGSIVELKSGESISLKDGDVLIARSETPETQVKVEPQDAGKVEPSDAVKVSSEVAEAPKVVKFESADVKVLDSEGIIFKGHAYEVDGEKVDFIQNGSWFTPAKRPCQFINSDKLGPMKIDVTALNPNDARKLQEFLIPLLERDEAFAPPKMLSWKTLNPAKGLAGGTDQLAAQDAKVFTLYCSDPAEAIKIQKKVDQMITDAGLGLEEAPQSGNVFRISGESNRVGIVRDTFTQSVDSMPSNPAINLDESLVKSLEKEFGNGERLSEEQIDNLIKSTGLRESSTPQIFYDSQGKLSMRVDQGPNKSSHNYSPYGVYVTEAGAGKRFGNLTDRPALYSLYDRYKLNPVDEVTIAKKGTESSATESVTPAVITQPKANGVLYNANEVAVIGRGNGNKIQIAQSENTAGVSSRHAAIFTDAEGNTYIADLGSTNGTYINGRKISTSGDPNKPNWVRINTGDKVKLGSFELNLDA